MRGFRRGESVSSRVGSVSWCIAGLIAPEIAMLAFSAITALCFLECGEFLVAVSWMTRIDLFVCGYMLMAVASFTSSVPGVDE